VHRRKLDDLAKKEGSRTHPLVTVDACCGVAPLSSSRQKQTALQTAIAKSPNRWLDPTFQQPRGAALAPSTRSNSFPGQGNSYSAEKLASFCFEWLADGNSFALYTARRSGAQRGAPKNNFGQRFSWAPLAFSVRRVGPPPPSLLLMPALPRPVRQSPPAAAAVPRLPV